MDSIGSGPVLASRFPRGPDTLEAPKVPERHELRLVNWSRTSRRHARSAIWFAALPFSLVNVAGQMADARDGVSRSSRNLVLVTGVNLVSLMATLTGLFWLLLIGETVLDYLAVGGREGIGYWTVIIVFVGYALVILARHAFLHRRRGATDATGAHGPNPWLTGLHGVAVLAVGVLIIVFPPTRWRVGGNTGLPDLFTYPRPDDPTIRLASEQFCWRAANYASFDRYLNPVNSWIVGSLVLTGVIAIVLALSSLGRRREPKRAELAGAAVALSAAMGLAHALGGSLRLAIEWILTYLDRFELFGWFDRSHGIRGGLTYLRGVDLRCDVASGEWLPNSFAGMAVLGLIVFGVTFALTNLVGRARAGVPTRMKLPDLWRYTHRLVASLPSRLWVTVVLSWLVWSAIVLLIVLWRVDGGAGSTAFVVLAAHIGAIVVVLFLFYNGAARRFGSTVADIIGFWPVRWHPLAGRSYRAPVLDGIRDELEHLTDRRVVLAGHSQGSVIAAWFVGEHWTGRKVHLVTCGSPLKSLYAHFFPAYFDTAFFTKVSERSIRWGNFWRETDPIATRIGEADERDDPIGDPPWPEKPLTSDLDRPTRRSVRAWNRPVNHGNYWADPSQQAFVADCLDVSD